MLFLLRRVRPKAPGAVDERRDVEAEGVAAVPFAVTSRCFQQLVCWGIPQLHWQLGF